MAAPSVLARADQHRFQAWLSRSAHKAAYGSLDQDAKRAIQRDWQLDKSKAALTLSQTRAISNTKTNLKDWEWLTKAQIAARESLPVDSDILAHASAPALPRLCSAAVFQERPRTCL